MNFQGPLIKLFNAFAGSVTMQEVIISFFSVLVILLLVFPVHECAHGLMAYILGDDTAYRKGRLTLNPIPHIDPMGAFMMMILPVGWAKPVEVNYSRCNKVKGKTAMVLTALAGPLSNVIMAYIFMIIYKILMFTLPYSSTNIYILVAVEYIITISLYLGVFNLLPVPPLDGSKVLFFFLKPKTIYMMAQYQQVISVVFMAVLFLTPFLRIIIGTVSGWIYGGLDFLSGFINIIFS